MNPIDVILVMGGVAALCGALVVVWDRYQSKKNRHP